MSSEEAQPALAPHRVVRTKAAKKMKLAPGATAAAAPKRENRFVSASAAGISIVSVDEADRLRAASPLAWALRRPD